MQNLDKQKPGNAVDTKDPNGSGPEVGDEVYVEFVPPTPDERGYLRRVRAALRFEELVEVGFAGVKAKDLDEMVDFLAPYLQNVPPGQSAEDILWDASEAEFAAMLAEFTGNTPEEDEADLPKETKPEPEDG